MNEFLWTVGILGVAEVAQAIAYWTVGVFPKSTPSGKAISAIVWALLSYWAFSLLK